MITTGIKCNRCLEELVLEEIFEGDYEIGPTYNFVCPNCGARFECTEVTEDEKQDYEFYRDGEEDISGRIDEEDIMNGSAMAFRGGWNKVKLYFMLGLPFETEEDIRGIAELTERVAENYYDTVPKEDRHGKDRGYDPLSGTLSFFLIP